MGMVECVCTHKRSAHHARTDKCWADGCECSNFRPCPHISLSGDEGPVRELGRMPIRWRCDECGHVTHDEPPEPCDSCGVDTYNPSGECTECADQRRYG